MRDILIAAYSDWLNNYISVAAWAEANDLTEEQGRVFIDLAREVFRAPHPDA